MQKKKNNNQQLYTDKYFESGHWSLKLWQTLIALLGWFAVITPLAITATSFWSSFNPNIPHIWSYQEGVNEIKYIGVLLLFSALMAIIFSITMTLIQNRKRERLVEQWPTFNPINQNKRKKILEKFINKRFGDQNFRKNVKTYNVQPEQNLKTHQIQDLYIQHNLDDIA